MRTITTYRFAVATCLWAIALAPPCLLANPACAETAFQFSAAGVQAPADPNVDGCRLSLFYGSNSSVRGVDLGLASLSESTSSSGFRAILGIHRVTGRSSGLALSLVNYHSGQDSGANLAFINRVKNVASGVNLGFVNVTDGASDVDISGLGMSRSSNVQVGFINVTRRIDSVQIGFLNFAENGFFPVFPFFNIPKN